MAIGACLSLGIVAYMYTGGDNGRSVLLLLALALLAIAVSNIIAHVSANRGATELREDLLVDVRAEMVNFDRRLYGEHDRSEIMAQQIEHLQQSSAQTQSAFTAGMEELRNNYAEMSGQMRAAVTAMSETLQGQLAAPSAFQSYDVSPAGDVASDVAMMRRELGLDDNDAPSADFSVPHLRPAHDVDESFESSVPSAVTPVDELVTSLEPIVDLMTNKTAHYRLLLGLLRPDGSEVDATALLQHVDHTNSRPGFDLHAAREALGLLRHLRQRDPQICIFMSIGAATLQSTDHVSEFLSLRDYYRDVAAGLIVELPHAALAGLSERGLEGLATLARRGVILGLSNISVNGIDANALSRLNVRYLSLSCAVATAQPEPSAKLLEFVQNTRVNRIMLIVTQVPHAQLAARLVRIGRFATGTGFASPRRVKSGVAAEATEPLTRAA
jgi:EAL domain-containing protein (putative c-di-GMP-specific phosphodiesterase class I)